MDLLPTENLSPHKTAVVMQYGDKQECRYETAYHVQI